MLLRVRVGGCPPPARVLLGAGARLEIRAVCRSCTRQRAHSSVPEHFPIPAKEQSVAHVFPELASEWLQDVSSRVPTASNGWLTPSHARICDRTAVWWRCAEHGHIWLEPIRARVRLVASLRNEYARSYYRLKRSETEARGAQTAADEDDEADSEQHERIVEPDDHPEARNGTKATSTALAPLRMLARQLERDPSLGFAEASAALSSDELLHKVTDWNLGGRPSDAASHPYTHVERSPYMWYGWNTSVAALGPVARADPGVAAVEMRIPKLDHCPSPAVVGHLSGAQLRRLYHVRGCPVCKAARMGQRRRAGRAGAFRPLSLEKPMLALEWHPTYNGDFTPDMALPTQDANVWWRCQHNPAHVWVAHLQDRTTSASPSCPFCRNQYPHAGNNVTVAAPEIVYRFDAPRNGRPANMTVAATRSFARYWYSVDAPWLGQLSREKAARMRAQGFHLQEFNVRRVEPGAAGSTLSKASWVRSDLQDLVRHHATELPTASDSWQSVSNEPRGRSVLLPIATAQKMERGALWLPLRRLLDNEAATPVQQVHSTFVRSVAEWSTEPSERGAYVHRVLNDLPANLNGATLSWSDVCKFVPTLHTCVSVAWRHTAHQLNDLRDAAGSMHPFGNAATHTYFVLIQVLQALRDGRDVAAELRSPAVMRALHLLDPTIDHAEELRQTRREDKRSRAASRTR